VIYAESEGLRIGAHPPVFRPARELNAQLRSANRGRLVVITEVGFQPNSARVALSGPGATGRALELVSSPDGIAEFDDLQPGEYSATARRIGLQPQSVRLAIAAGFADTLLFSLGQP
jgi:hypothetical protein